MGLLEAIGVAGIAVLALVFLLRQWFIRTKFWTK